jgi:hypothetical protein
VTHDNNTLCTQYYFFLLCTVLIWVLLMIMKINTKPLIYVHLHFECHVSNPVCTLGMGHRYVLSTESPRLRAGQAHLAGFRHQAHHGLRSYAALLWSQCICFKTMSVVVFFLTFVVSFQFQNGSSSG